MVDRVTLDLRKDEQLADPYLAINPRGAYAVKLKVADGQRNLQRWHAAASARPSAQA